MDSVVVGTKGFFDVVLYGFVIIVSVIFEVVLCVLNPESGGLFSKIGLGLV